MLSKECVSVHVPSNIIGTKMLGKTANGSDGSGEETSGNDEKDGYGGDGDDDHERSNDDRNCWRRWLVLLLVLRSLSSLLRLPVRDNAMAATTAASTNTFLLPIPLSRPS